MERLRSTIGIVLGAFALGVAITVLIIVLVTRNDDQHASPPRVLVVPATTTTYDEPTTTVSVPNNVSIRCSQAFQTDVFLGQGPDLSLERCSHDEWMAMDAAEIEADPLLGTSAFNGSDLYGICNLGHPVDGNEDPIIACDGVTPP